MTDFKSLIREVDDWPKPGVGFKDVTSILGTDKFTELIDAMADQLEDIDNIDAVSYTHLTLPTTWGV